MPNKTERGKISFKYEGKFFFVGAILGCILGILWQDFYVYHYLFSDPKACIDISKIEKAVNSKFIDYINGKWSSSVGDLIIQINGEDHKNFIVIENLDGKKSNQKYEIQNISNINGILGVMNLNVCSSSVPCTKENFIPIQINKIFGKDKTIAISYDSRITYCIDSEDNCTRAFKRIID